MTRDVLRMVEYVGGPRDGVRTSIRREWLLEHYAMDDVIEDHRICVEHRGTRRERWTFRWVANKARRES